MFRSGPGFGGYTYDPSSVRSTKRKARFINEINRRAHADDTGETTFSEVKAVAGGDPLLIDKASADAELASLERAEKTWLRNHDALRQNVTADLRRITGLRARIAQIDDAISRRGPTRGDAFIVIVGSTRFTDLDEAGKQLKKVIAAQLEESAATGRERIARRLGHVAGFELTAITDHVTDTTNVTFVLDGAPGAELRLTSAVIRSCDPGNLAVRLGNLPGHAGMA